MSCNRVPIICRANNNKSENLLRVRINQENVKRENAYSEKNILFIFHLEMSIFGELIKLFGK